MQISEAAAGAPLPGAEPCRFPKLEECAHFHYERVQLPKLTISLQTNIDRSLHSQHSQAEEDEDYYMVQVTSGDECWLLQRNYENFQLLDAQLHQCIYDRKIFQLPDLSKIGQPSDELLYNYLERFSQIADNSINCGPVLNWLQMDNKGHRLLVPSEESRSINTPAVAAAYSVRRYVSQARDELNLEVGDMISVIDMANPAESIWWRGKRGFQVGFFPQHCVHIIGDKVPRNMPLPAPVVGSLALITPIKPVLRKHGKLITFFRSFILNRPSRRRLKQSGILKERVFGCDLGEHLLNSGHEIPMVLKCCAEFIEKCGIVDGIYRLSGVTSNIQKLRNAFDEDRIPNLYTDEILQDIHSVASLLKMYFRELPNPLCTYQLYQSFVNAVQGCNNPSSSMQSTSSSATNQRNAENDRERLLKMREAVQKLPPPHYRTLEYLMRHLAKVAKHGPSTGMTTRNVAIVWAPNLLRCAELEVGGVAALQGVGVQAVVTEFLICYSHLIFCDHLSGNFDLPVQLRKTTEETDEMKRGRPKSLAISTTSTTGAAGGATTPNKLITLEEARRSKQHLVLMKNVEFLDGTTNEASGNYIEVGGGPKTLPKKYHTIIELPVGAGGAGLRGVARKRSVSGSGTSNNSGKRSSPLGWRSFFKIKTTSKDDARLKAATTPTEAKVAIATTKTNDKIKSMDLIDAQTTANMGDVVQFRKLRTVKSAESLTSTSTPNNGLLSTNLSEMDVLAPLSSDKQFKSYLSHKSTQQQQQGGHNRSISHDSYFDQLQTKENESNNSSHNSETSLMLDLSEIQLNFELEESEMRIFSEEDESLVSSPRIYQQQQQQQQRRAMLKTRQIEANLLPSPKKHARVVLLSSSPSASEMSSPSIGGGLSRKRTRLEDQLSDIQYIDCTTPENMIVTTNVLIHHHSDDYHHDDKKEEEAEEPHKKSPRNSNNLDVEKSQVVVVATPTTPPSPSYHQLNHSTTNSSSLTTPSDDFVHSPSIVYENLSNQQKPNDLNSPGSNNHYENILTTISITYKSASPPLQSLESSPVNKKSSNFDSIYENVNLVEKEEEKAVVPTETGSLPCQQAKIGETEDQQVMKSTDNLSVLGQCGGGTDDGLMSEQEMTMTCDGVGGDATLNSNRSSGSNIEFTLSAATEDENDDGGDEYEKCGRIEIDDNGGLLSYQRIDEDDDLSLSEVIAGEEVDGEGGGSCDNLSVIMDDRNNPSCNVSSLNLLSEDEEQSEVKNDDLIEFSPCTEDGDESKGIINNNLDKRKIMEESNNTNEQVEDDNVYEQVKFYRRSIHEVNALLDMKNDENEEQEENYDSLEPEATFHVYENVEGEEMKETNNEPIIVANNEKQEHKNGENYKPSVKDLKNKFENVVQQETVKPVGKFYDKAVLPPCLRARNLKHQLKTRSLDEDEFHKEFGGLMKQQQQRRSSIDESAIVANNNTSNNYKTNSLPKKLNQPKFLPIDDSKLTQMIHLAHSNEKLNSLLELTRKMDSEEEEMRKRERIEKYKEERRKYLQDKYRSESFREDKDVLLSQLKIFKNKEDNLLMETMGNQRRKTSKSEDLMDSLEEREDQVKNSASKMSKLKTRAAIFESNDEKKGTNQRNDDDVRKIRRNTYERDKKSSDNEVIVEANNTNRISLDSKIPSASSSTVLRAEKQSPSYCIKDMKAIFESKSKK